MRYSLSDAEAAEDGAEDFIGGDLTRDGAKVVEGVAEVYDHEVGGQALREAFTHMGEGIENPQEGVVVAHIGEERCPLKAGGIGTGIEVGKGITKRIQLRIDQMGPGAIFS